MSEIKKLFGLKSDNRANKPDPRFIIPDKCVGVEVEFEGVRADREALADNLPLWSAHEDGSLHNRGLEFVFKSPMYGADIHTALTSLMQLAAHHEFLVSKRTGIHVHLDVRDLEQQQLAGLILYYALFEPVLYKWVEKVSYDRAKNNFCVPWFDSDGAVDTAKALVSLVYNFKDVDDRGSRNRMRASFERFDKYAGCNLRPIQELGSIEFRQLPTTFNVETIETWINLIFSLNKAALDAPASNFALISEITRKGVYRTFREVFGPFAEQLEYPQLAEDVNKLGLPVASELAAALVSERTFKTLSCPKGEFSGLTKYKTRTRKSEKKVSTKKKPLGEGEGLTMAEAAEWDFFRAVEELQSTRVPSPVVTVAATTQWAFFND